MIAGKLELSPDGLAMKYYEAVQFVIELTPDGIADLAKTLSAQEEAQEE